jgi:predicted RNA-binding protein YlxR (DUF448 family)
MPKKVPMRKCVVTNERYPKKDLIRVVRTPDNEVIVDVNGKANGHGAYCKKDIEVIELAQRKRILDKALECQISDEIYEELKRLV